MKATRFLLTALVLVLAVMLSPLACSNEEQAEQEKAKKPAQKQTDNTSTTSSVTDNTVSSRDVEAIDAEHIKMADALIGKGVEFLISNRDDDGGWSIKMRERRMYTPAITALVLKALVQHPDYGVSSPIVKKGFEVLLSYQQDDGGIYDPDTAQQNYTTAIAVMALAAVDDEQYKPAMDKAVAYLRTLQILPGSETADGELVDEDHPFVGGVSYGQHGRPDLDNVGMWMQALHDAGVSGDDPAMQKALIFVNRCQNRSESNPSPWAAVGPNDGGFIYAAAIRKNKDTGESKAGAGPDGKGYQSYGSVTYMGLKSLLYANVDKKDGRVLDAINWVKQYWRLDSNPNLPKDQALQGLYFSYYILTKSLRAYGNPIITDMKGVKHNWRHELIETLKERINENGSWKNPQDRWAEGDPVLVTSYSVLALQESLKK